MGSQFKEMEIKKHSEKNLRRYQMKN